jgi:hypothetical protein
VYIDDNSQPIMQTNGTPYYVGGGTIPMTSTGAITNTDGVQVSRLQVCIPAYFAGAVGLSNFNVGSSAPETLQGATTHTSTHTPYANAPFYVFARSNCQDSSTYPDPSCVPPPNTPAGMQYTTYRLFADGATDANPILPSTANLDYAAMYNLPPYTFACSHPYADPTKDKLAWCAKSAAVPYTGDLVTLHNHSNGNGNWDAWQFVQPWYGLSNTQSPALPLGSQSNRGCLDPSATPGQLSFGMWTFNRPGNGSACGALPVDGSAVVVPFVDQVCKNGSCGITADSTFEPGTSTPTIDTCANGGFCARIVGEVQITIVRSPANGDGKLVQGYITKVVDDPYCLVEASTSQVNKSAAAPNQPNGHPYPKISDVPIAIDPTYGGGGPFNTTDPISVTQTITFSAAPVGGTIMISDTASPIPDHTAAITVPAGGLTDPTFQSQLAAALAGSSLYPQPTPYFTSAPGHTGFTATSMELDWPYYTPTTGTFAAGVTIGLSGMGSTTAVVQPLVPSSGGTICPASVPPP